MRDGMMAFASWPNYNVISLDVNCMSRFSLLVDSELHEVRYGVGLDAQQRHSQLCARILSLPSAKDNLS
jgi:hypothetical protein